VVRTFVLLFLKIKKHVALLERGHPHMGIDPEEGHSIHFARCASKLERHLIRNGISCRDADLIIEESSALYFDKLHSHGSSFFKLIRKHDPAQLFAESASKAVTRLLPEAKDTFGSRNEIARCIR
jgi:hypothetical protein